MRDILFIKTSSLGDVVHNMPAVTDARRAHPDARIAWVVEEDYAPLARLHPGVDDVIPVATRRWRKQFFSATTWSEIWTFVGGLRSRSFDRVVDTQGLLRTALIARFARGQRHGYDSASVRERPAVWFYDSRHAVSRNLHAIDRNRRLAGLALGYAPQGAPDFGLPARARKHGGRPSAILLHGSAQAAKEWPQAHWVELARALEGQGLEIVLPWGNAREKARSETLAAELANARVPDRTSLDRLADEIAGATLVVGLDTGLLHLAAALQVPLVGIFVASDPALTGPRGPGPIVIEGSRGVPPAPQAVIAAAQRLYAAPAS